VRILTPGFVIGAGLGGFFDGIVLHQILQWHNMRSAAVPPVTMDTMAFNMRWDGLFHAATWVITFTGVWMLWAEQRIAAPDARRFAGQLILGWGTFNLVEGVVDHHLLQLHHVRDMPVHVPAYDWAFLLTGGLVMIALGAWLGRAGRVRQRA
jgi:uncharacterized membrane protein